MYSYRIDKSRWWEFARACREFYAENHPVAAVVTAAARNAAAMHAEESAAALGRILDTIRKADDWMVDLQIFDEGNTYLVRPLERGYMFLNTHDRWAREFGLKAVFYDDRSDVPPEQVPNREVSLWCDDKIQSGEFFIHQIVTEDSLSKVVFDIIVAAAVAK